MSKKTDTFIAAVDAGMQQPTMGFADIPSADPTRTISGAQIPTRVQRGVMIKQQKLMDSGKWGKMSVTKQNAWLEKTFKSVAKKLKENI